jgi:SOS-response transcriptional repressor LexA
MGERIVAFIDLYIKEHGYSPSFREIPEAIGVRSTSHVSYWIDKLVQEKRLTKEPNISRSVRVAR